MSDGPPDMVPDTLGQAQEKLRALLAEREYLWQRTEQAEAESRKLAHENAELSQQYAQLSETKEQLEETKDRLEQAKAHAEAQVERLKKAIRDLKRRQHGPKSERLDPEQFRLALDDLTEKLAKAEAELGEQAGEPAGTADGAPANGTAGRRGKPRRNQGELPDHLPRVEDVLAPEDTSCPCCGCAMHVIDEDVTEQVEYIPASIQIRATRRPRYGCRQCEGAPVQAEAPESPVPGGLATCRTVAHLLTAKYIDGLPASRQCEMIARQGLELDRSTVVRWMGAGAHHLEPLYDALFAEVMSSAKIFGDETPAPTLEVGRRTTKKAYLWAYARDDRAWNGPDPPAVVYRYASGRGKQHPAEHLQAFRGILQVDGYRAYDAVAARRATGEIVLAQCWSHIRRPIHDIYASGHAPVAEAALRWIRQLYAIEDRVRGCDAATRRQLRQEHSKPLLADFHAWLDARLTELPPKDELAKTFKRLQANWHAFTLFVDDGRVELDTNRLETLIKNVAVGRKAFLFAGNSGGGHTWAMVTSIVQTCRMNGIDPQAYLADVLQRIVSGEAKINRIHELLPWNWAATSST